MCVSSGTFGGARVDSAVLGGLVDRCLRRVLTVFDTNVCSTVGSTLGELVGGDWGGSEMVDGKVEGTVVGAAESDETEAEVGRLV